MNPGILHTVIGGWMMKIYNKIVLDMETLTVLEEDFFWYHGEIAHCGGGGGDSVDKKYNRRMATIAEAQQAMAEEQFDFWRETYKPFEVAQVAANMELMPFETAAAQSGLQLQEEEQQAQRGLLPQKTAVTSKFYEEALEGIDVNERMDTASADVSQAFKGAEAGSRRAASRMGLNATSGRTAEMLKSTSLEKAKAIGSTRATTRMASEGEQFQRLTTAQQFAGIPAR